MNSKEFENLEAREEELFKRFLENGGIGTKTPPAKSEFDDEYKSDIVKDAQDIIYNDEDEEEISTIKMLIPNCLMSDQEQSNDARSMISSLFSKEGSQKLTALAFIAFLVVFLCLNILTPSKKISEMENRTLALFPDLSFERLSDGSFMKDFESYISDQFVFRNHFVSAKRRYEVLTGKEENHGILFCNDGYLIENSSGLTHEYIKANLEAINALTSVKRYNVSVAIVPTAYEILKEKLPDYAYTNSYKTLQNQLKKELKNADIVDTSPILSKNADQYLYYRTDHHQTAHGSYYTYSAICPTLGIEAATQSDYVVKEMSDDFYGTAWSNSGFGPTRKDTIYMYAPKKALDATVSFPLENKSMNSLYNEKMLSGKDKYAFYLDGNHGIAEIKTNAETGKKLAIIKDSYAHSVVPFLAGHYNEIYMIDLRYYNGDIFEYLYANNINDVLVLYNQNTFMTDNNLSKITEFSKVSPYTAVPDVSYGIVPEQTPVDDSYFDNAVFVGDSLTIGIENFSGFNSQFLCMGGLNTQNLETASLPSGKSALQAIKDRESLGKLYIMLGTNEVIYDEKDEFAKRYGDFIDKVREKFPDVIVYIQSILPITKEKEATVSIKNSSIVTYNERLLELAKEKQCYYIDLHSYFKDDSGALPYSIGGSDGIHLGPVHYRELATYLKGHAVPETGVVKIEKSKVKTFAGKGKFDTVKIGDNVVKKVKFKDTLLKVADSMVISAYKVDSSKIASASLYLGGGATAEEVAVFEATNEKYAKELESKLVPDRIERKKLDFKNYIPAEMTKLNNPYIIRKGKVVVVCIADKANTGDLEKLIK